MLCHVHAHTQPSARHVESSADRPLPAESRTRGGNKQNKGETSEPRGVILAEPTPAHPQGRASQLEKPSGSPPGVCHLHSHWKLEAPLKWLRSTSLTLSYSPLGICCIRLLLFFLAMSGPLSSHSLTSWVRDPETDGQAGGFPLVSSQLQDLSHQIGRASCRE